jgi:hypothetical protein
MAEHQRPDRAGEVAVERRRRDGQGLTPRLKLHIPDHIRDQLAAEGRTPRWVNDTNNRIADLTTRDDYDAVEGVEPVKVGTDAEGQPLFAHLLAKRTDFLTEDRAKADQRRREVEAARFTPRDDSQPIEGQMGAPTYIDPATKIGRANQVLE